MASAEAQTVLDGVLEQVVFSNEETGWSVIRLNVPGHFKPVTAVGNLLGVQPGESLRLRGHWETNKQYGEQFKAESYTSIQPATVVGIEKYLGSGMVRGIGQGLASRIVARFGIDTLDVIDAHPERLGEVEGIGPIRTARIQQAWGEQKRIREVMIFLQSHGVSTLLAVKIVKRYGDLAIATVRENPYRLAIDIFGIGFQTADKIASSLGIAASSPERAQAGVLHVLGQTSDEGHVYVTRSGLVERAREMLGVEPAVVEQAITDLAASNHAVVEPLSGGESAVFLGSLYMAEAGLALMLLALLHTPAVPIQIDIERALSWFEEKQGLSLAPEQRDAIRKAVTSKVLVITGGPGTGKTTLVNGIIRILEKKGRRILLAAPTGRAAKRMTETTGHEAETIHRLLEYSPTEHRFQRDRDNPLEADLVILDEASMLDTTLAFQVVKALPPRCQLVLVGDVDQLPSVGPGSVLGDIIHSGAVPVVRLSHIFRQSQQSLIIVNAHRINAGQMPEGGEHQESADFFFIERKEPEQLLSTLETLLHERLPKRFGLDPVQDVQVLTPMQRGTLGAAALNARLQALLNPHGAELTRGSRTFRVGDKVMQIRNNYDLDVYNGDVGRVEAIDTEEHQVHVAMDGRRVIYDYADLDEVVLAYAATIHKSQGSEYPCVVLPLHTQHYVMLARNLLYTGVTRGKKLVVVVGSKRALAIAVKNSRADERLTRLSERLRGTVPPPPRDGLV